MITRRAPLSLPRAAAWHRCAAKCKTREGSTSLCRELRWRSVWDAGVSQFVMTLFATWECPAPAPSACQAATLVVAWSTEIGEWQAKPFSRDVARSERFCAVRLHRLKSSPQLHRCGGASSTLFVQAMPRFGGRDSSSSHLMPLGVPAFNEPSPSPPLKWTRADAFDAQGLKASSMQARCERI